MHDDAKKSLTQKRRGSSLRSHPWVPVVVVLGFAALLGVGWLLVQRAGADVNKDALDQKPKAVSVITAAKADYQPVRNYLGTLQARAEASIGPQEISAYVETVLVRPGAVVKRGEVLATLDCRNANSANQAVAMKAKALDARLQALEDESTRYQTMLDGGFMAVNQVEQQIAHTKSQEADVLSERATLAGSSLAVNDCILRAPFDGEVATRLVDPGAFVKPGTSVATVIDRGRIIVMVEAPEHDFPLVSPGTRVVLHMLAVDERVVATVTRRAPKADVETRTVHFEVDLQDQDRRFPIGTTARIHIDAGKPVVATKLPLYAANVRGEKVQVFVADGEVARQRTVRLLGEAAGQLYVDPAELPAGTTIVTQGREILGDGDAIAPTPERSSSAASASASAEHAP